MPRQLSNSDREWSRVGFGCEKDRDIRQSDPFPVLIGGEKLVENRVPSVLGKVQQMRYRPCPFGGGGGGRIFVQSALLSQ